MDIFHYIVLGAVQGVSEWLPISSSGAISLVSHNFFSSYTPLTDDISLALFLHLGTLAASLIYFKKEVAQITRSIIFPKKSSKKDLCFSYFLLSSALSTAIIGGLILFFIKTFFSSTSIDASAANAIIGVLLLITAWSAFQSRKLKNNNKEFFQNIRSSIKEGIGAGAIQGIAVLPGISRSGVTIAYLLERGVEKTEALKVSFLMSIPVILGGNIVLELPSFLSWTPAHFVGLCASFLFGLGTIKILILFAQKVNFATFTFIFGVLLIFISILPWQ